jgi:large subunit ribosomal protein L22
MEVRSIYKTARVSPKKARDVAREIQGLPVSEALDTLTFTPRKAAFLIGKTLKSAIANAENNHDLAADNLVVKEANVSSGPTYRRFKPRARGSASAILKRTSHIAIILSDEITIEEKPERKKAAPKQKPAAKKPAEEKPAAPAEEEAPEEDIEEIVAAEEASEETPAAEADTPEEDPKA